MAFRVPSMPLTVDIYRISGTGGTYGAPDVSCACALSPGKRIMTAIPTTTAATKDAICMELLLPKLTDIRATWNGIQADLVEVPAGSKRFYGVDFVDDVAKGFANEYRIALIVYVVLGNTTLTGGPFAAPVPLP